MARRNRRRGRRGTGDLSRQRRDRFGKAAGRVVRNAGRRSRLHLRPAVRHVVQRRVPRLGRRRRPAERERPVQLAADGQRLAGVLPALEAAADRQEADDRPREVRDGLGPLLPSTSRAADEPELHVRPELPLGLRRRRGHDPRRDVPGPARAARGASRRHAGLADDGRRGEQPDELAERRQRLRRRAQASHAQQHRQRRRVRRHVGRRADAGRVPGAPPLVRREPHVPVEDAEGRAARRVRRPREGRHATCARARSTTRRTSSRRGRRAST